MTTNNAGSNSQKNLLIAAAIVIAALLALNIFLFINKSKQSHENQQLSAQLDDTATLKAELEKEYYQALSELEEMRGSNEELNALIDKQEEELTSQKGRIDVLLRDKRDLDKAKAEIKNLTQKIQQYLAEVNQLREENQQLSTANTELSTAKQELETNLEAERQTTQALSTAKESLEGEKQALEKTKTELARKVNIASVIKVNNVEVTGQRTRDSGKTVKRKNASNIDQLEICFQTTVNDVAEAGSETYMIRIINPQGETMAIESLGSGVFVNNANGERMRYTLIKDFSYDDQNSSRLCGVWSPGSTFPTGNYKVEVYNKGYLAGAGSFKLN